MALPTTLTNVTTRKLAAALNSLWNKIRSTFALTGYQGTKQYHIAVKNTSTSPKGWCSIVRVTKTSGYGTYDAVRIIGRLFDHKGNWEQSASEYVDFLAVINISSDTGTLYLGKSGISAEMRLVKVAARDYELQYNASTTHCDYDVYYQIEGKTGYATPTTTYTATTVSGTACSTASLPSGYNAFVADKATGDESGNNIKTTYASSLSLSNHTLTLKNKNGGTLSTITVPDNSICGYCASLAGDAVKVVDIYNYTPTAGNIIYINFANSNAVSVSPLKMKLNGTEYTLFTNGISGTTLPAGTWPCSFNGTAWTVWTDGTIPNFGQRFRDYDGTHTYSEIRTRMEYGMADLIAEHGVFPYYANLLMPLTWAPSTVDADIAFGNVVYGPPGSTNPVPWLCQTVIHSDNTITHTQTQLLAASSIIPTIDSVEPLLTLSRGVSKQGTTGDGKILGFYDSSDAGGTNQYGISFAANGCLRYNNSYILTHIDSSASGSYGQSHLFDGLAKFAIAANSSTYANQANTASTSDISRLVSDYNSTSNAIEIGWAGSGASSVDYFAVYVDSPNGYAKAIKDCSVSTARSAIFNTNQISLPAGSGTNEGYFMVQANDGNSGQVKTYLDSTSTKSGVYTKVGSSWDQWLIFTNGTNTTIYGSTITASTTNSKPARFTTGRLKLGSDGTAGWIKVSENKTVGDGLSCESGDILIYYNTSANTVTLTYKNGNGTNTTYSLGSKSAKAFICVNGGQGQYAGF